jgi:hypothetical protein
LLNPALNFDFLNLSCRPALDNLAIGAPDTLVTANQNTKYYTIAGDWNPSLSCPYGASENLSYPALLNPFQFQGLNDGLVPIWSAKSAPNSEYLGPTHNCHSGLLIDTSFPDSEYGLSKHILLGEY